MTDDAQPLRFDSVARDSTRWQRADPDQANLMRIAWDEWVVHLPDGDGAHVTQLHYQRGTYHGRCDCQGYDYDGICAHLCTLSKADALGVADRSGRPVEIDSVADRFSGHVERAVTDGGAQP